MKAVILKGMSKTIYQEVPDTKLPGAEWVKIRVQSVGLCGSDVQKISSYKPSREYLATPILGHEIAGTIVECGNNVNGFRTGDSVAVEPLVPCNKCEACRSGDYELCVNLKSIGNDYPGGFAEYTCAPYNNLHLLPDNVTFNEGALFDPVAVAFHAVHRSRIKHNNSVAIIGDGTIGLCVLQTTKIYKANSVVIGKHKKNLDLATSFGASETHLFKEVKEISYLNNKFDFIFECVGRRQSQTINLAVDLVKPGGTINVVGVYDSGYAGAIPLRKLFYKETKVIGSNSYSMWEQDKEFNIALKSVSKGLVHVKEIITHEFPLCEFERGVHCMKSKAETGAIKVVYHP
jgi:threonine dehydrogenase-like Zn-dependent dehydrogenase